jgi:hypothetical protein
MLVALLDVNGRVLANEGLVALARNQGHTAAGSSLGDAARNAAAVLARRSNAAHLPTNVSVDAGTRKAEAIAVESEEQRSDRAGETQQASRHRGREVPPRSRPAVLAALIVLVVRISRLIIAGPGRRPAPDPTAPAPLPVAYTPSWSRDRPPSAAPSAG